MSSFGSNKRSRNNDNDVERKPLTFEQRKRRLYNQSIRELNAWIEGIFNNWAPKLEKPQSGTKPSEESQRAENQLTFFTYEYDRVHKSVTDSYQRPTGDVIFMGSNDMRQLGRTDEVEDEDEQNLPNYPPVFMQLLHSLKFISLAAGGLHTAALTNDGNVYTWGPNDEGATGRPRGSTPAPTLVQGFYSHYAPNDESAKEDGQIMDVQAGNTSLIYLTINGNVYTSGSYRTVNDKIRDIPRDEQGRFTDADPFEPNWGPIHIPLPQKARLIRAGDNFFVAQLADGTLWTWGLGTTGQLARSAKMMTPEANGTYDFDKVFMVDGKHQMDFIRNHMLTPGPVIFGHQPNLPKTVVSIACGGCHMLVVARDQGSMDPITYAVGLNVDGQLGLGPEIDQAHELTVIPALRNQNITKVAAGSSFSLALNHYQHKLFSFGLGDKGQLGLSSTSEKDAAKAKIYKPTLVSFPATEPMARIVDIMVAETVAFAITSEGEVYTWGFNGERQTGHDTEYDVTRPQKLKFSGDLGVKKVFHAAGGAQHSVMVVDSSLKESRFTA